MKLLTSLQEASSPEKISGYIQNPTTLKKETRNNIIYARKKVIDIIYEEYTARLTGRKTIFDLGTGIAQAGFNAAGTVVPLAETKGILAAAALGLTGTQNAVNKSVFYDKTVPLLKARMDADRKAKWQIIKNKMDLPLTEAEAKTEAQNAAAANEAAEKVAAAKAEKEKAEKEKEEAAKAAAPKPTAAKRKAKTPQADSNPPAAGTTPATGQASAADQKPKTYYSLLEALCDLEDYYTAGSLSDALMSISNPTPPTGSSGTGGNGGGDGKK